MKRFPAQFQPHLVAVLRARQTIQVKGNERIAHVAHHVSGSIVPQLNFVGIIGVSPVSGNPPCAESDYCQTAFSASASGNHPRPQWSNPSLFRFHFTKHPVVVGAFRSRRRFGTCAVHPQHIDGLSSAPDVRRKPLHR